MSTTTITLNATITTSTPDEGSTTATLRQIMSQWNTHGPEGCCAYRGLYEDTADRHHAVLGAASDLLDQVDESGDIEDIRRGLEYLLQTVSELRAGAGGTEAALLPVVAPLAAAAALADGEALTTQGMEVIRSVVCAFELAMVDFSRYCAEGVLEHQGHDAEAEAIEEVLREREPEGPPPARDRRCAWGDRPSPWRRGSSGIPYNG